MTGHRTKLIMSSAFLASATLIATPIVAPMASAAPSAAAPAVAKWTGSTGILVNKGVSQQFLRQGVAIIGEDPAGGTQITSGKLAYALPVSTVRNATGNPIVEHFGGLTFSVGDGYTQRSVVLKDITVDLGKQKVTAKVLLEEASAGSGGREYLDTITVFTFKARPSGPSSFPFTLFVSKDLASAASGHLGWFPAAGARLGSGFTDLIPPS